MLDIDSCFEPITDLSDETVVRYYEVGVVAFKGGTKYSNKFPLHSLSEAYDIL